MAAYGQKRTFADPSLNHLVCPQQQRWRNRQAEGLSGLQIDGSKRLRYRPRGDEKKKTAAGKALLAAVVVRNGVRPSFVSRSSENPSRRYFFARAGPCTFSHTVVVMTILPSIEDRAGSLTMVSLRPSNLISRTDARCSPNSL